MADRENPQDRPEPLGSEPFSYRTTRQGNVFISYRGREVTTLAGAAARQFLARIEGADPQQTQLAMAKATGNFKRGNERDNQGNQR